MCYNVAMIVLDDLSQHVHPKQPSALTIGSFDGVHKGHQYLLQKMRELVGHEGSVCIVTFSNHPSHVLGKDPPAELLFSKEQKLRWLSAYGVDVAYCVPFTKELAALTYQEFLEKMMQTCPFDFLVLGEDAHLGNRKQGTPERVTAFCKERGIQTQYLKKLSSDHELVSSRRIRSLLASGKVSEAIKMIGHPLE